MSTAVGRTEILESLREVVDPELNINIVEVGLIYRVEVHDGRVEIDFTLTTPGCPLGDTITEDIKRVVQEHHGIRNIELNLVWTPTWTIEFMSEEARLELGFPI